MRAPARERHAPTLLRPTLRVPAGFLRSLRFAPGEAQIFSGTMLEARRKSAENPSVGTKIPTKIPTNIKKRTGEKTK